MLLEELTKQEQKNLTFNHVISTIEGLLISNKEGLSPNFVNFPALLSDFGNEGTVELWQSTLGKVLQNS